MSTTFDLTWVRGDFQSLSAAVNQLKKGFPRQELPLDTLQSTLRDIGMPRTPMEHCRHLNRCATRAQDVIESLICSLTETVDRHRALVITNDQESGLIPIGEMLKKLSYLMPVEVQKPMFGAGIAFMSISTTKGFAELHRAWTAFAAAINALASWIVMNHELVEPAVAPLSKVK